MFQNDAVSVCLPKSHQSVFQNEPSPLESPWRIETIGFQAITRISSGLIKATGSQTCQNWQESLEKISSLRPSELGYCCFWDGHLQGAEDFVNFMTKAIPVSMQLVGSRCKSVAPWLRKAWRMRTSRGLVFRTHHLEAPATLVTGCLWLLHPLPHLAKFLGIGGNPAGHTDG